MLFSTVTAPTYMRVSEPCSLAQETLLISLTIKRVRFKSLTDLDLPPWACCVSMPSLFSFIWEMAISHMAVKGSKLALQSHEQSFSVSTG